MSSIDGAAQGRAVHIRHGALGADGESGIGLPVPDSIVPTKEGRTLQFALIKQVLVSELVLRRNHADTVICIGLESDCGAALVVTIVGFCVSAYFLDMNAEATVGICRIESGKHILISVCALFLFKGKLALGTTGAGFQIEGYASSTISSGRIGLGRCESRSCHDAHGHDKNQEQGCDFLCDVLHFKFLHLFVLVVSTVIA